MFGDNSSQNSTIDIFFRDLDRGFINFKSDQDSLTWNSSDCTINFECFVLPIPVFLSGSTVSYSFSTCNGDISFGVIFVSTEGAESTLAESTRVPSHIEAISGNFKAPSTGKFVFCWDNKFSWFTPKILSYSIELHQPSFAAADNARSLRARTLLHGLIEDSRRAEKLLASSTGDIQALNGEILNLTARIRDLQEQREAKLSRFRSIEEETAALRFQLTTNSQKNNGLCMRILDRNVLAKILSYFDAGAVEPRACKYWTVLHMETIAS